MDAARGNIFNSVSRRLGVVAFAVIGLVVAAVGVLEAGIFGFFFQMRLDFFVPVYVGECIAFVDFGQAGRVLLVLGVLILLFVVGRHKRG